MREDGRKSNELRPIKVSKGFINSANGSVLIEVGYTRVICTATFEDKVPHFLKDTGQGWVTAEYSMLPASTGSRKPRESSTGRVGGRTHEIQRLIGRSLRSVVDLSALGEMTIWIDCDVIQADGGTRTASITGAYISLAEAINNGLRTGLIQKNPITGYVAAASVGIVNGEPMLDLCYQEDSTAEVDMNIVMTDAGKFVEIQGTAEGQVFGEDDMMKLIGLGKAGISELIEMQKRIIGENKP